MNKKPIKTLLIWLALLNWPPILIWVPFLRLPCFLPYLFWINFPAQWCGLGQLMGKRHYVFEEFGALPQTTLSWGMIVAFWIVVAIALTAVTAFFPGLLCREKKEKKEHPTTESNATSS